MPVDREDSLCAGPGAVVQETEPGLAPQDLTGSFRYITSLTVLAKCPLGKRSSFLGPQFNSSLPKASVPYFQGPPAFSSGQRPGSP